MTEDIGKDFNFYERVTAIAGAWPATGTEPDAQMAFRGPRSILLVGVSGSDVEYSFNGNTIHGRISAGQVFPFELRNEDKIWLRGSGEVDIHAWRI